MSTRHFRKSSPADTGVFSPAEARPGWWHDVELVELEHTLKSAISGAQAGTPRPVTIASAQRGDHYAAVALGGPLDAATIRALSAHLRALLDSATRHLVIDLSRVGQLDERLHALLRRVEARMAAYGGVLELTGLTPRVLHHMDDDPLARVFVLYRTAVDDAAPDELSWAARRCPRGLGEVAEPHTAGRHRTIIDTHARRSSRAAGLVTDPAPAAGPPDTR
jgi:ABC-type transporter Mla MlaB component